MRGLKGFWSIAPADGALASEYPEDRLSKRSLLCANLDLREARDASLKLRVVYRGRRRYGVSGIGSNAVDAADHLA